MKRPNRLALARFAIWYTFVGLAVYIPLETFVTVSSAGWRGILNQGYIANVIGMALMSWGALSARNDRAAAPGLLAAGWAWTAATFWRATAQRFWAIEHGDALYAGPIELWLAPIVTALALLGMVASLALVVRSEPPAARHSS